MKASRKWYVLFTLPLVIAFAVNVYGQTGCKKKTGISALPHSFTGVSRCQNDNEWMKEAQAGCRAKLRELYPEKAYRIEQFYTPVYEGSYAMENVCTRHVLGRCVDYRRECTATFSLLDCSALICRKDDDF